MTGIQYREIEAGSGPAALLGSVCEIRYVIYRLASGAYFKYSSGGTPVFLYGLGYGTELKQDLDEVYKVSYRCRISSGFMFLACSLLHLGRVHLKAHVLCTDRTLISA